MDGTPINPYATSSFRIFSLEGIGLYSSPYFNEENKLAEIPYLTDDLTFYGYKIGEQSIPEKAMYGIIAGSIQTYYMVMSIRYSATSLLKFL